MATVRERSPGVWEVRVFVGGDSRGKPVQVSRTVRGTKRAAQKVAALLTVEPPAPEGNRTVSEALDAWLEVSRPTWAVSSLRDQTSRVSLVKRDAMHPCWSGRAIEAVVTLLGERPLPGADAREWDEASGLVLQHQTAFDIAYGIGRYPGSRAGRAYIESYATVTEVVVPYEQAPPATEVEIECFGSER